eukprot:3299931-Prymnesium_polylepis.1
MTTAGREERSPYKPNGISVPSASTSRLDTPPSALATSQGSWHDRGGHKECAHSQPHRQLPQSRFRSSLQRREDLHAWIRRGGGVSEVHHRPQRLGPDHRNPATPRTLCP